MILKFFNGSLKTSCRLTTFVILVSQVSIQALLTDPATAMVSCRPSLEYYQEIGKHGWGYKVLLFVRAVSST